MASSRVVCSVGRTTSWLSALVSSPAMSLSTSVALMPAAHTTSSAGMEVPLASVTPFGRHLHDARRGMDVHLEALEELGGGLRKPLRQRRENARRCLDQVDLDVLVGIDAVEAVGHQLARRLVQLGGQLGSRRTGADDGHLQLLGPQRLALRVRADAGVDETRVKALRLLGRLERNGIRFHAARIEVVGQAADGDDERIVAELLRRA